MKVASMVCTYLYGSLSAIKTVIETYIKVAKNLIKRLDAVAQAAATTIRYTIDTTINTIVNMVKVYEKELFDMLYDSIFGSDRSFWCNRLWKCIALLQELLDPDSWLFKKLNQWWEKQCTSEANMNLLANINDIISDFSKFQQTVCSAGFTIEFGISYIKKLLNWCKEQLCIWIDWCERKWKELKKKAEAYLNQLIDWGVLDYLEKLLSFFMCVFDDSESCAEIATASNFYADAMSKFKLEKDGDGYNLSTEYRNSLYGGCVGAKNRLNNLKMEIDNAANMCVDPQKLKKANAAYNLSENLLPQNDDGSISWTKIKNGQFQKCKFVSYVNLRKDALLDAISQVCSDPNKLDYTELENGTKMDPDGTIWYRNKCEWVPVKLPAYITKVEDEVFIKNNTDFSNDIIFKGNDVISIAAAAKEIRNNPNSDFSRECTSLYRFINSWKYNSPSGVLRFNNQVI